MPTTPNKALDQSAIPSADRTEMVDALYRFAAGQDLDDAALFESAFSLDATLDFTQPARQLGVSAPVFQGLQQISEMVLSATADLDTTHSITNVRVIAFDGERATVSAMIEAQHLPRSDHSRHLLLKNLLWVQLVRTGRCWRIQQMRFVNVWRTGDPSVLFPDAVAA